MGIKGEDCERRRTKSLRSKEHYDKMGAYSSRHLRLQEATRDLTVMRGATREAEAAAGPVSSGKRGRAGKR
eukprot:CAMPEP_0173377310 /NCGR_PEP_ID=MMETSP1356-20130122/496_1 /TAXON_ID=77927 ORGANISM="Hemiselmis virescens, Strain PCC157" /NCGR_SAMPLE_ID=MMETSP1356 /ASSEMBLY_ACC=CAM_ASM_000847 /LENGTH=70 /DNA_ID=CAMNT_0014329967 /DNA_START=253 /DNA_END=465 /DNA_ORIENTATION=-